MNNRQKVSLSQQQNQIFKSKFRNFKQIFNQQQSNFSNSPQTEYYIVSTKYLEEWTDFCSSSQLKKQFPSTMNNDLMDAAGQLRQGLQEKKDFEIVNKRIFELIKISRVSGFELPRTAVLIGDQKRVAIYLVIIKYIKISYQDVSNIDRKKLPSSEFRLKSIEASPQQTVQSMLQRIRKQEDLPKSYKIRLWKNSQEQYDVKKLIQYIRQQSKPQTTYRFKGVGKLIQQEKSTLQQVDLGQKQYFIVEASDEYQGFYFRSDDESKCENCYKYKKLTFICGCKKVGYCSQYCQQKDKNFHGRNCKYVEQQQLNQQIEMNITKNSSLGIVGLSNLGNTCFMNSCLQCLSNTRLLTNYFLGRYFMQQINKENPLGSKGRLSQNYAKFIKNMWCESSDTYSPSSLKAAVAKLNPIFAGYAQHDSQQFFSYIVDGIHEDLNRIIKKPYVETVQSKNRPDQQVAFDSWLAYTSRNQSIIVDLMTGQYKSKVTCPSCKLESITFDPFTTVSLPIPQQPTIETFKFFVVFNNFEQQTLKMSIQYIKPDLKEWHNTAASLVKRNPKDFVFYVLTIFENIYSFETTSKAEIINKIENEGKNCFFLQLSQYEKNLKERVEFVVRICKKSSSFYDKQLDNLWFKRPFFFEKQQATVEKLYRRILQFLYYTYTEKKKYSKQEYISKMLKQQPFKLVFKYRKTLQKYYSRLQTKFDKQIELNHLSTKLSQYYQLSPNLSDCEVDARFDKQYSKYFEFERMKKTKDGEEHRLKKTSKDGNSNINLSNCFQIFQEKEQLEVGNQWYCPQCKDHKLASKQLTIYKAPEVLILHLKRFKNKGTYRKQKNNTTVDFPTQLNMEKYLIDPKPMSSYINQLRSKGKYVQPAYKLEVNQKSEPKYELFAISNHYGGLGGGHYTAYAKNNQKWYQFNDSSVHSVSESSIKGPGAYMLFYKRTNSMQIK